MNIKRIIPYILSLSMLAGCGGHVGTAELSEPVPVTTAQTENNSSETTAEATVPENTQASAAVPTGSAVLSVSESAEVYDRITLGELIDNPAIQLENGDEIVDTSETGVFEITARYIMDGVLYEQNVEYTVEDTTAPILLNSGNGAEIKCGKTFDLTDYVGFGDNYDRNPGLTYTGQVDTSVCGTYPLEATVTDASGNSTSWNVKIKVVDELSAPEDNNPRVQFSDFIERYAGTDVSFGIDVSKWQGNIDFEAVKNAGCSFVIMRIGHYYDEYTVDEYYRANMAAAKAAGLDVGVYLYTTANSEEKARENAQWIAEMLDGVELDFPIAFDWESFSNFQQYGMSINDLNEYYEAFKDETERLGYSAMLYSSKNFLNNFWYEHSDSTIWLAHYTDETDYTGRYSIWQASCYGNIDGIYGDVDMNILYSKEQ